MNDLVNQGYGEWLEIQKIRCIIFWKKPSEWAELIYKWVNDSGLIGRVCTVYELREGDDTASTEFHGMDQIVLLKILKVLETQGKAQVFSGNESQDYGVKFFTA